MLFDKLLNKKLKAVKTVQRPDPREVLHAVVFQKATLVKLLCNYEAPPFSQELPLLLYYIEMIVML
ncbi:8508_t:CDS:2 [Dentiscutata erythropus]|uniref:8508_t:CDS:1 n=1 Tax=Dentiscutata erythropus TaxID=1348616 RepID=A0A9N9AK76_9GLOM|nr:8508_t:CDS:2 [Dentiscutata erythropus]